jgi:tetratricopeptide (TPR) repeat protein
MAPPLRPQNWTLRLQTLQAQLADPSRATTLQIGSHLELADLFDQARNYSAALDHYRNALDLSPTCIDALIGQANVLRKLQRYDEAIALYNQGLAQRPTRAELWLNRGHAAAEQGRLTEALADYDRALQLDPNQPQTWQIQGDLLYRLGRHGGAIISYAEARSREPLGPSQIKTDYLDWENVGPFVDRYRKAFGAVDAAIATDPNQPKLWIHQANRLVEEGFPEEAIASLQTALHHCPRSGVILRKQAELLSRAGRLGAAEVSYQKALALSVAEGDLVGEIAVRNALTILAAQLPRVLPTIVKPVRRSGGWAMVQRQWQSWAARGN